jgi:hypothetical protein
MTGVTGRASGGPTSVTIPQARARSGGDVARTALDVQAFALVGARARYEELRLEVERLLKAFPELKSVSAGSGTRVAKKPGRKKMSAKERAAVSKRMRAYWAARKK